jgi:hypothetical protein
VLAGAKVVVARCCLAGTAVFSGCEKKNPGHLTFVYSSIEFYLKVILKTMQARRCWTGFETDAVWQTKTSGRKNGGERGIRTLGAALNDTHDFQSCSFNQLGHLSAFSAHSLFPEAAGLQAAPV